MKDTPSTDTLWTVPDVAAYLRMSRKHVYRLVELGELPHIKIGRCVRFDPADIATWLDGLRLDGVASA